ncbi:LacI family DNA-binding transcriptional regulator [Saccharopolyspora flava]|uniref:DNA-binding transcriptional regulator, LacI/PurR family n=1 Tax=Saccharopolyspora flava TaxID=95161 RepID=A0A1I6UF03_9PSEU|nr:LacI family DNA-binding transcriptional regulator [Saccharopolyspora flava]SFS99991.1 DNA-binding transcriptional regulator, LacI/PurR family [Saccharopolyspora flava]
MGGSASRRRVTAADVARSLGVSRATVGFVLNNTPGQTISEATRERVLAEAERLGYRPHQQAQALRRGSSRLVLLVLPDWPIEFTMRRHLEEASLALDEAGYSLVTYTRHEVGRTRPLWELLSPSVVLGFAPFDADEIASMRACGITDVFPTPEHADRFFESPAFTAGPRLQVEHLRARGHQRLAFAASPDPRLSPLVGRRARVAEEAAGEIDVVTVDHRDDSARTAVRRWRAQGRTGVIAYNDDAAAAVIGAAVRDGLDVPEDLAVIGHDDSPLSGMFLPSISSIRLDPVNVGRYWADLALLHAEGKPVDSEESPDVNSTVIVRESTGG